LWDLSLSWIPQIPKPHNFRKTTLESSATLGKIAIQRQHPANVVFFAIGPISISLGYEKAEINTVTSKLEVLTCSLPLFEQGENRKQRTVTVTVIMISCKDTPTPILIKLFTEYGSDGKFNVAIYQSLFIVPPQQLSVYSWGNIISTQNKHIGVLALAAKWKGIYG
jgi:hypothetical protein